jgi:ssDNA-binding Zn-finger/Zn-ribbon topoisomerase 1
MKLVPRPERPICPKCHKPMRLLLVKGNRPRMYRCIDCDGEDPLHSPDVGKLLEAVRPPQ